jgi:hypothetical protein
VTAGLVTCATGPRKIEYQMDGPNLTTPDGLRRVKNWQFRNAYVKPGADLARYEGVIVGPVSIAYKHRGDSTDPSDERLEHGTYELPPGVMEGFERDFEVLFSNAFRKSKIFDLTQQPAPDALRVRGHIVDLVVYTPQDWNEAQAFTRFQAFRGEFMLILDVRDSKTGEPLVRVGDRSAVRFDGPRAFYPSNRVTSAAGVRRVFHHNAKRLRRHLDALHKISEMPPAPEPVPASG